VKEGDALYRELDNWLGDIPFDPTVETERDRHPSGLYRQTIDALRTRERHERRMANLARIGRELVEREDDELESLALSGCVDGLLSVIRERAANRARALAVLEYLRRTGHVVTLTHCAARVAPEVSPDLARLVDELQSYLCDHLEEERHVP
jgi:glycine/D-amino acid oxidase-like deaminating enzyme